MTAVAGDGLSFVRFILVWSSLSPVFILWAIRGTKAIDQRIFTLACLILFLAPTLVLWFFWNRAKVKNAVRTVTVIKAEDPKDHILTYLFAMLIPLFQSNLDDVRQLTVAVVAFGMIMFMFLRMKLHYMSAIPEGKTLTGYRLGGLVLADKAA